MTQPVLQGQNERAAAKWTSWARGWLIPTLRRHRIWQAALVATLLAALYWGPIASDRYVSETHVIVQKTDLSSGQTIMDFSSLLGNSGASADQLLLRDYLLSVDMLLILDAKLDLRSHYSGWSHDPISRMLYKSEPVEWFYRHYLSRVSVDYDDYANILVIKAQAYDAKMARAIASTMVAEGERHMNDMAHDLAQVQVNFLEKLLVGAGARNTQARQALLNFQNQKGLISPQGQVETVATIVAGLEGQVSALKTSRSALLAYLMPDNPSVLALTQQIDAVERQLSRERARLVSTSGKAFNRESGRPGSNGGEVLNSVVEQYLRLQMSADLALDVYKTALVALEKGRIEASRSLKKLSILQSPTAPQYPLEPKRIYNIVVFILIALLVAGIMSLLAAIIRDHKD